ncbi:hypothetical protein L1987_24196 [Smallanthus sonchifolius]|uniref:Uncharacterized protein n=1 Tax=Smallanthus sonchifolius TaxID=185202 RepID=A0ACB9IKC9_9ASTR|nr:hypothetical protein L1987_24196 [Smallanthus sonchifolius]
MVADSMVLLLGSGADREPEIIEQKYLMTDVVNILKVTKKLRFYPKDYIQEFMAESVFFLLRNAPVDQINRGSNPVVEVVITVFQWLCEEMQSLELEPVVIAVFERLCEELKLLLQREQKELYEAVSNGQTHHLTHLLSLFISTLQTDNVHRTIEFKQVLKLVKSLIETFIMPCGMQKAGEQSCKIIDKILQLLLCILDGLHSDTDVGALAVLSAPVFEMRNKSALTDLIMTLEDEAMYLAVKFFEKVQSLEEKSKEGMSRVCNFLQERIRKINDGVHKDPSYVEFKAADVANIWGTISCYSYMTNFQADPYLLMEFVEAIDLLLKVNSALPRMVWESLIGAGLASYQRLSFSQKSKHDELPVDRFLYFAKNYKCSIHILSAVADFLDSLDSSTTQADDTHKKYRLELEAEKTIEAFNIFSENLCHSDKQIHLLTLRILCHYEFLNSENQPLENDMIIDDHDDNVLHSLLAIEATPLSIATSRKVVLLISKIHMDLLAKRICDTYIPLVFSAVIGIFHNRFNYLWNPAIECFVMVGDYHVLVWETCMKFLDKCVSNFVSHGEHIDQGNSELHSSHDDLPGCFNQFVGSSYDDIPSPTVLSLLLKALQKVSTFVESRSRQIIPLFLKFLGYEVAHLSSVRSFSLEACKGKVWKGVLGDWLNLLKLMRNPKALLLDENDPEVQLKVLDCLLNWKDEFLVPYAQNLRNLVNPKTLRDELTRWSLSRESRLVSELHRDSLVPLAASMHHRKAVIGFLAELDINELPLFFASLIKPLQIGSSGFGADFGSSAVLRYFTMDNASLAPKQYKDLRSFCLKIISLVLSKFEDHDFSVEFWDIFLALKPLIDGFKQEGANSEKPSSLFVCFLAMSKSHKLGSQFHRANNLVPDIFSLLTVSTASEAIISCVLRFIENLLNLDIEVDSRDANVKGILLPNIDTLVCCLHHLFTCKNNSRKSLKPSGGRELSIFKLLPKYIEDPSIGKKFIDILVPSLTKKPHDPDSCVETLHVIQKMVPMSGSECSLRIFTTVSTLLIHAALDVRLAICGVLDFLAGSDPSLVHLAKLLRELNATSPMEIDVLDYDVVIGAYEKINIDFFCGVREEQTLIILSHCVHDMSSLDLILRNSAYGLLLLFLEFCQKIISVKWNLKTGVGLRGYMI